MEVATYLLCVVIPGRALSIESNSNFVGFYNNVCPPCLKSAQLRLQNPCCSHCDCDLATCSKYGTCCLGAYSSFEAAYQSVSQTM